MKRWEKESRTGLQEKVRKRERMKYRTKREQKDWTKKVRKREREKNRTERERKKEGKE